MACPNCDSDKVFKSVSGTASLGWLLRLFIVINRCHSCGRTFPQRKRPFQRWIDFVFGWSSYAASDDKMPLSPKKDIRLIRIVETLVENLRITLFATVVCFFGGLVLSIPANFVIDPPAARYAWFGGAFSSHDRVTLHRERTTALALFGGLVGLVASQSIFWSIELGSRQARRDDTPGSPDSLEEDSHETGEAGDAEPVASLDREGRVT